MTGGGVGSVGCFVSGEAGSSEFFRRFSRSDLFRAFFSFITTNKKYLCNCYKSCTLIEVFLINLITSI